MTSMLAISTTLLVLVSDTAYSAPAGSNSDQHPTLSQMWTAVVKEAEVGVVYESENFVSDHEVIYPLGNRTFCLTAATRIVRSSSPS